MMKAALHSISIVEQFIADCMSGLKLLIGFESCSLKIIKRAVGYFWTIRETLPWWDEAQFNESQKLDRDSLVDFVTKNQHWNCLSCIKRHCSEILQNPVKMIGIALHDNRGLMIQIL